MAYPDPKGERDSSLPGKRRSGPGVRAEASRDPRDMAKARLPEAESPADEKTHPPEGHPFTGAMLCDGMLPGSSQPSERGALPSEGN